MGTPPTIWCTIQRVQPLRTCQADGIAVTVADREGTAVTIALQAADLDTYASFQAAVLHATGQPFRYLPITVRRRSSVPEPAWLARISRRRPVAMLHKLPTVPLVLKGIVKRVLAGTSIVPAG